MKETEELEEKLSKEKNMKEDTIVETRRGRIAEADPQAGVRTAECSKKVVENLAAEPDSTAQEGIEDMRKIEIVTKEGQQRPDMLTEIMKERKEGKKITRREQEVLPEEGEIGKIALIMIMNMNMKEKEEHQEGEAEVFQEVVDSIEAEQGVEEADPSIGEGADPHGLSTKARNGMMKCIGGTSPKL